MNRRFSLLFALLALLAFNVLPTLAYAQEPTPTIVPALSEPVSDTKYLTLSLQIEQSAEFGLFAFYQAQDAAAALIALDDQLEIISQTLAYMQTVTDPVVVTDTLPSGNQWQIRREFSYGDITAGLALIAIFLLFLVRFIWDVSRPQQPF